MFSSSSSALDKPSAGVTGLTVTPAVSNEPLIAALARHGVALRRPCGGVGTCHQCRVRVDGVDVLACQTCIDSTCQVEVPITARRSETMRIVAESCADLPPVLDGIVVASLDLGTTTLAMRLLTASGAFVTVRPNPQTSCGDDLMSRIQYAHEPSRLHHLQHMVTQAASEMLEELARHSGVAVTDVKRLGIAGNTVMQHIFFGIDIASLGRAPFTPAMRAFPEVAAPSLGLAMAEDATVEMLPILGGFVGGDVMGGVLTMLADAPRPSLLIDIGTNGEIVVVDESGFVAAATAAGPAFEGSRLRAGVVATSGAIESIAFDAAAQCAVVKTIDNAPPIGLCGSGVIDAIATLLDTRTVDATGRMRHGGRISLTTVGGLLAWELVAAAASGTGEAIVFTQRDVREFQLACGAIRTGIELLLRQKQIEPRHLHRFFIAGGFGQHIAMASARRVGLIPQGVDDSAIRLCGNTSLAGATQLAVDPAATRAASLELQRQTTHIDLALLPNFSEVFAASMSYINE